MARLVVGLAVLFATAGSAAAMDVSTPLQANFAGNPALRLTCDRNTVPALSVTLNDTFRSFREAPDVVIITQDGQGAFVAHASAYRQPDDSVELSAQLDTDNDLDDFIDRLRDKDIPPIRILYSQEGLELPMTISSADAGKLVQQFDAECAD